MVFLLKIVFLQQKEEFFSQPIPIGGGTSIQTFHTQELAWYSSSELYKRKFTKRMK
ncbi:hypothetical protein HYPBUDRAFT_151537 [Hyphopichia burtonii NRRL Y-1933]|uniref:Uncharacterized protein n=1 Tax=Hyphopichia burtonii NRRL Y-1933 TaxID=984485 RepID=A0A1E4RRY7_9ASCO|nr:hypothetical protein HYPBUDRAFT_151537 [Hyphopichia burtonii NRRL Y-1933]ODV70032.1 hypothetical protein HYPBUDRAFT_151537 [Hyphopichia burtonii NRRL Y-1933]